MKINAAPQWINLKLELICIEIVWLWHTFSFQAIEATEQCYSSASVLVKENTIKLYQYRIVWCLAGTKNPVLYFVSSPSRRITR